MKSLFKTLLHVFLSVSAVSAATALQQVGPVTAHTVLLPALTAGALAAFHAAMPSTVGGA